VVVLQPNTRSNINVAKPTIFSKEVEKVLEFLIVCRLFIRIKIRNNLIEEQV